jgi:hypothetical protein
MGAPGTIPISIRRRVIALDPCTLTTRAARPEGSVSSDPDWGWLRLDFLSFFLNSFLSLQAKLKMAFNFATSLTATGAPHQPVDGQVFYKAHWAIPKRMRDARFFEGFRSLIEHIEEGFPVGTRLTE